MSTQLTMLVDDRDVDWLVSLLERERDVADAHARELVGGSDSYWAAGLASIEADRAERLLGQVTRSPERVRHWKTGDTYTIVSRPRRENDLTPAVVYRSDADGSEWERTEEEFNELVLWPDGVMRPRFTPIQEGGSAERAS